MFAPQSALHEHTRDMIQYTVAKKRSNVTVSSNERYVDWLRRRVCLVSLRVRPRLTAVIAEKKNSTQYRLYYWCVLLIDSNVTIMGGILQTHTHINAAGLLSIR